MDGEGDLHFIPKSLVRKKSCLFILQRGKRVSTRNGMERNDKKMIYDARSQGEMFTYERKMSEIINYVLVEL